MTRQYVKTGLWCTVIFLCVSGLFLTLERTNSWDIISVHHMPMMFADTIGVLAASDCQNSGVNVYEENPCDPWSRVQVLGSSISFLGKVGLDISDSYWLGWTVVVLFWISALFVTRPSNPIKTVLILAVLVSTAVMLGAERANIDLFLFCLITVSIWLVIRFPMVAQIVAGILVFLAAITKLYPAAAAIGLLIYYWKHPGKRWTWIAVLAFFGVWIAFNYLEVIAMTRVAPKPAGWMTFGGELLFRYLAPGFSEATRLATVILFLLVILLALLIAVFFPLDVKGSTEFQKITYVVGLSILVFCFVATSNYDYRNIYFIFLFPFLFFMFESTRTVGWRWITWVLTLLIFFSMWREVLPKTLPYYRLEAVLAWLMFVPLISIALGIIGLDDIFREQLKKRLYRNPSMF